MPDVVFDTVVFVRSLLNPHGVWGRLVFAHYADYRLILSRPVLEEILEVLDRPELKRKYRTTQGLDRQRLFALFEQAELVDVEHVPAVSRDPKDDKFLATARAGAAQYLVSEDHDLLDLKEYEGVQIVDAVTFLQILER